MLSLFGGRRKGSRNVRRSTRRRSAHRRRGAGRSKMHAVGATKGRMVMTRKGWRVDPSKKKKGGRRHGSRSARRVHRRRGSRHTRRRSMIARMLGLGNGFGRNRRNRFGSFGSGRADSLMQAMGPFPN